MDMPALTHGVDVGVDPTPVRARAAARGGGVGRATRVVPHQRRLAGQPRRRARAGAPRRGGRRPAQRPLEHDRRAGAVGDAPDVRGPGDRPRARDRALPDARRRSTRRWRATPRRGRRVGDLADVLRRGGGRARAGRGGARARRAAGRRRGLGGAHGLPRGASRARARGGGGPGDLEHPQDRRQPDAVGDAPPRRTGAGSGSARTSSTAR